jgi:hypothetical protein
MIQRLRLVISVLITCPLLGQAAVTTATERPCQVDIEKYCSGVHRGGGRVAECLRQHQEQLSPECKARGQEVRERIREAHEECKEDVSKFCGDVRPGEGHIVACLRRHENGLSAGCRTALEPAR